MVVAATAVLVVATVVAAVVMLTTRRARMPLIPGRPCDRGVGARQAAAVSVCHDKAPASSTPAPIGTNASKALRTLDPRGRVASKDLGSHAPEEYSRTIESSQDT